MVEPRLAAEPCLRKGGVEAQLERVEGALEVLDRALALPRLARDGVQLQQRLDVAGLVPHKVEQGLWVGGVLHEHLELAPARTIPPEYRIQGGFGS